MRRRAGNFEARSTKSETNPKHNEPATYDSKGFIGMVGQELSGKGTAPGNSKYAHVTGMNLTAKQADGPWQQEVDAVNRNGGLPILAHPRWSGATAQEVLGVNGASHMEVQNGLVDKAGRGNSSEKIWTGALDSGRVMYGVGASDSHDVGSQLGRVWTQAWAKSLTPEGIEEAYRKGHIFGSSGPEVVDYEVSDKGMSVSATHGKPLTIQFIGKGGEILSESSGNSASYRFRGNDSYVRVAIASENGWAFGQPHFLGESQGWSTKTSGP